LWERAIGLRGTSVSAPGLARLRGFHVSFFLITVLLIAEALSSPSSEALGIASTSSVNTNKRARNSGRAVVKRSDEFGGDDYDSVSPLLV
jgi:hypothetical protein